LADCHTEATGASSRALATGQRPHRVALIGNPNTGKSSVFMALTGQRARVGNYPGITIERLVGNLRGSDDIELVDLPGAYSLSARSAEEQIALRALLGLLDESTPDLAVIVIDSTQLGRNLYLALQILELGIPSVVCLNMTDEAQAKPPSVAAVSSWLGVPCVATSARTGQGIDELQATIDRVVHSGPTPPPSTALQYSTEIEASIGEITKALPSAWQGSEQRNRGLALWALLSLEKRDELVGVPESLRDVVLAEEEQHTDLDEQIIQTRWAAIDSELPHLWSRQKQAHPQLSRTDRVDRVLLHPILGFAIFVAIMFVVFWALFAGATPAMDVIQLGVEGLGTVATSLIPAGVIHDLVVEGVIGGVGNVVIFLPQILLLFLFIGFLEDTGYMARVAYLMDRIMKAMGLHGRAFVPMLSGFACAVPAVMATRTMERKRDRLLTMLVVPLMSCSARLPVYTLIIGALFPASYVLGWVPLEPLMMVTIYLFSTVVAIVAAGVLGRTVVKGRRVPLILELPPYRMPRARAVIRMMFERSSVFVKQAGTVILVCTIIMWGLLYFPRSSTETATETSTETATGADAPVSVASAQVSPAVTGAAPAVTGAAGTTHVSITSDASATLDPALDPAELKPAAGIQSSYAGMLGRAIEPVLRPLGFDWKISIGIIGAFAAREVFVSTLAMVYGLDDNTDEESPLLRERIRAEEDAEGKPVYTPLMGISLMVFFALACQCMSTLAVVRRETRSWRWPAFLFAYMTALAWVASFIVYQGGRLLGFG
jgi:ferrous iron transport protein B